MKAPQASRRPGIRVRIKRTLDIVVSAMSLMLLAPLFLIITLVVKLSSKGPVMFVQNRAGQFLKPFSMLKFRTMYDEAGLNMHRVSRAALDPERILTQDPRVTPAGRFLRKWSLDELPQYFNVLSGDMSLVGPRALTYDDLDLIRDLPFRHRFDVKPGITGLWQVSNLTQLGDMLALDNEYVSSQGFLTDLKVLLRTISVVFGGTNRIAKPPGTLLSRWAEFFLSPQAVQYVVTPILADMQIEYLEALAQKRGPEALWIRFRGYWSLVRALGFWSVLRTLLAIWRGIN